jgi:hypothetical protein
MGGAYPYMDLNAKYGKLLLASIYRSPSSDDVNNGNLNISLKKLCNMSYSHLLLFGDMNFPHIDWNKQMK